MPKLRTDGLPCKRYASVAQLDADVRKAGSVRKLAEQLGVTSQAIYQMRKRAERRAKR